ncbi:MAG TPA: MlaD family protein [Actinomycetota bacterium]|nr:MlaD family protein [Actinomycetota bacterium]
MITKRVVANLVVFLALAALLVWYGANQLLIEKSGGKQIHVEFSDASGLGPRNDVTMRGVPVGSVKSVTLTPQGVADVVIQLQPGIQVPGGSHAQITRRSPIGDLTLDLEPGTGADMADGATIPMSATITPPDPERTIAELAKVLGAVPSSDLSTLVHQLALAVKGRGQDLATLSEVSGTLPARILQVQRQLDHLIRTGPSVTHVFAANAGALRDDIAQTAVLADILRDRRHDLVSLSEHGADFATLYNQLLTSEKANVACLINSFGTVNAVLAQPNNLQNLKNVLDLNHYFFDAVWQSVQVGKDGLAWFRVQLLPHQEPAGREYAGRRPPPDVYGADACRSIYGKGVGRTTQPGPVWLARGSHLRMGHN